MAFFSFIFRNIFCVPAGQQLQFAIASASHCYFLSWNVLMLLMQLLMEDASGNEGN